MIYLDTNTIGFPFLDEVANPIIRLTGTGVELRSDASYYFDNTNRLIDSYLFQYTLEGSGIFETPEKKYILDSKKAFFTYIPGNSKYYCNPDDSHWKFLFVLFMGNGIRQYYDKITSSKGNVFFLDETCAAVVSAVALYNNAVNGRLNNPLLASAAAFDFLCRLCYSANSDVTYSYLSRKLISLFESDFSKITGIADMADALGVTQSHLTRHFSKDVGITPLEYLTKVRLNHALELLVNTNYTVNEIAKLCGYSNGNYFCKVFKKYMNITPVDYRTTRRL